MCRSSFLTNSSRHVRCVAIALQYESIAAPSRTAHGVCLLLWSNVMKILAGSEVCVSRILGNVGLQRRELLWASHEVVKTLFLPKPSSLSQSTIDLPRREPLPGLAHALNFSITDQPNE